ncbi:uncharacterized protein LOC123675870 [Harmonia axyridis]|uniref:uncharacterized protein LOC123675870 n=1 Tax=Harmonia axyridis TaxID=115357 RepID=UPI001E278125|nr:uncharacterized protein LOC123675870 [Harmonia axyridis]
METNIFAIVVLFILSGVSCFIIPDEIPSLLSVIYSNIPIIKKGTDSRVGWGFRLGDRADFQFLVELGPQKYTQPLANEPDKVVSNKRNTLNDLASQLWAQRQEDKRKELEKGKKEATKTGDAGSWLQNWSSEVQNRDPLASGLPQVPNLKAAKPGLAIGEIDAKSVIPPDDELNNNRRQYSRNLPEASNMPTTSEKNPVTTTTIVEKSENDVK